VFDVHAWGPRQLVTVNACEEHITPFFSSDGRRVFARGGTRWIKGFETGTWKPYASYHARAGEEVDTVADDLSRVAVTRGGADPGVVTVETGAVVKLARPLPEQTSYVMSPDGLLVAGAMDGVARVWSAKTGAVLYEAHR
jgi:WD40 repeat protein